MIPTIATGCDNIWLTADTHFHHSAIIKYCHRPFLGPLDKAELARLGGQWHHGEWKGAESSNWKMTQDAIDLMNRTLIDCINKTVPADGMLIHLGDFALWPKSPSKSQKYLNECMELRNKIRCKNVKLIWGNHDISHEIGQFFQWAGHVGKIEVNDDLHVILFHYCGAVWDRSHRSAIHCYGHSHSDIEGALDILMPGRRSMDVGVDNAAKILGEYRPFNLKTEIIPRLTSRPGFSINSKIPTSYKGADEEKELRR